MRGRWSGGGGCGVRWPVGGGGGGGHPLPSREAPIGQELSQICRLKLLLIELRTRIRNTIRLFPQIEDLFCGCPIMCGLYWGH